MEASVKKVVMQGGPRDGEVMELDSRAAYMVCPSSRLPQAFVAREKLQAMIANTAYYRVPIIWTPLGWRAKWDDRQEVKPRTTP